MIYAKDNIIAAREMALKDKELAKALRKMHRLEDGACMMKFSDWVDENLEHLAVRIGRNETVEHLVKALRVDMVGDDVALDAARRTKGIGFESDIGCYVDDNTVYSSVWIKAPTSVQAKIQSETIRQLYERFGFEASVWVDEEDDTEVSVNAKIDFPVYLKNLEEK